MNTRYNQKEQTLDRVSKWKEIYERISKLNKYVFWDIDGTLVAYRFNRHVADLEGTDNGMSIKEIDDKHIWLDRNYLMIKDRILVFESFSKADCIIEYCKKSSIELKDTIYVDDIIKYSLTI